jgi:hypothetical protein
MLLNPAVAVQLNPSVLPLTKPIKTLFQCHPILQQLFDRRFEHDIEATKKPEANSSYLFSFVVIIQIICSKGYC